MELSTVITASWNHVVSALTPLQRWDALTRHHSSASADRLFVTIGCGMAAILLVLLLYNRFRRRKILPTTKLFDQYAEEKGLTENEYNILVDMAVNAGLKQRESIFMLPSTFDRESANMLEAARNQKKTEQFHQMKAALTRLRAKMGFLRTCSQTIPPANTTPPSTREIPIKKKIYIKTNRSENNEDLEAVVIANNHTGLTVLFQTSVEIVFGQIWKCRYYFGTFVSEFDTMAIKCHGRAVVLSHSDQVHLVNRRKFLRVPVSKPAYIAHFPFKKEPLASQNRSRKKILSIENTPRPASTLFEPPQFVPATVTELGGPGLRVHTSLKLQTGDRVLLVVKLNPKNIDLDSIISNERIIEHIATVRHITNQADGLSAALELTDLNDDGVNELIRATNETLIHINRQRNLEQTKMNKNRIEDLVAV